MTDIENIRDALSCIPPDLPRDEWARVGMALKSELGDAGFDLFEAWSSRADGYKASDCKSTWQSIKAGGGVGIGSLFHLAKSHGYELDKTTPPRPPNADELRERAAQRKARDDEANAGRERGHEAAAVEAARMWASATDADASPYLQRKNVKGVGVRAVSDGTLFVPLRDVAGKLWNIQRIAPQKPTQGTDKLFLKGGRKTGLFHLIGEIDEARALLVCEGAATGFSLHEATGLPVAIAFDSGNLFHVAKALRAAHPAAMIVVSGDDDGLQHADTKNPGRDGAIKAATAIGARWVLPNREHLPEGGSDFNDAHVHAGLEAVKTTIENAIETPNEAPAKPERKHQKNAKSAPQVFDENGQHIGDFDAQAAPDEAAAPQKLDPFMATPEGVFHFGRDREGNALPKLWICSSLEVLARTRDAQADGWGYLLSFANPDGAAREWPLPASMLSGDGNEYRARLMAQGLQIAAIAKAKNLLSQYIQSRAPQARAKCVDRLGWHGRAYILPRETLGEIDERILFQSDAAHEPSYTVKGSLQKWNAEIGALCIGNLRLTFAASCAFAGIMARPAGVDSGGFHFVGDSSSGKTTLLRVAASLVGAPEYMKRWRATDNGLESLAVQRCDGVLILDEYGQIEARIAGEAAYLLANESAKVRSTKSGGARASLVWKVIILSCGEEGVATRMLEAGKKARAGQEIRLIDLPADAGAGFGCFDMLHGHEGGAALSEALQRACARTYGAPGRAFLEWAVANVDTLANRSRTAIDALVGEWVKPGASGQISRAAQRFALVAVSGELAIEAGAVAWPMGECVRAGKALFDAFVAQRGGVGNSESYAMLRQAKAFFDEHGDARFTDMARAADDHAPKTMKRAGFRKTIKKDLDGSIEGCEYLVLTEVFRTEIAAGYDYKSMLKMLKEKGVLKPDKGRPFDCKTRIPGMADRVTCYRITSDIHALDCHD
jgi:putative DNA primase/helicase